MWLFASISWLSNLIFHCSSIIAPSEESDHMPVVFRWKNLKFFFFSNEGDPREPPHVHVRSGGVALIERVWHEHFST